MSYKTFLRSSTFIKGVALFISHIVISWTHSETQIHIVHVKFYAYWLIGLRFFFLYRYENLSLITRRNSNFQSWSLLVVPSEEVLNRWHFGNSADIKAYINRLFHRTFLTKDIHNHGCSIRQRIRKEDSVHLRRKPRLKSAETLIN